MTQTTIKTLEETHAFIVEAQQFFSDKDGLIEEVLVEQQNDEPSDEITEINELLQTLRYALNELDCRFHDLFGCR